MRTFCLTCATLDDCECELSYGYVILSKWGNVFHFVESEQQAMEFVELGGGYTYEKVWVKK